MKGSRRLILIAVFASITAILDSIPGIPQFESGVWYSWIFLVEPTIGFILGPTDGFLSVLLGVMIGHYVYFRGPYEFLFTLGAPVGAAISGLLFQGRRRIAILPYAVMLTGYFLTPISAELPLWGMWDVYAAFTLLLSLNLVGVNRGKAGLCAFIGLEADILFRVFLFVPLQTYRTLYGFTPETMRLIWVSGALMTPLQVALSILFTVLAYPRMEGVRRRFTRSPRAVLSPQGKNS